jgi:hypothetical protein
VGKIKVITVSPSEGARVTEIENTLEGIQSVVGGYFRPLYVQQPYVIIHNEEGEMNHLPPNPHLPYSLLGTVFITKEVDGEFVGLTDEEIPKLAKQMELKIQL